MTENQEKELFTTLATLVTGVNKIQTNFQELKTDVQELKTDVQELKTVQKEHTQILNRLDAKTDNIAEKVLNHEGRLTKLETEVAELQSNIH